jgi:toxin-antitoxin system PIN domain toxin
VILCDSGVWLALSIDRHTHHVAAREWMMTVVDQASVFFCRATQQSLLRLLTTATVFVEYGSPPLTNQQAWEAYDGLLADNRVEFQPQEPAGLELRWRQFAARDSSSPKLWMDAYLAAFAMAGGYQMVTTDAAFKQFEGLDLKLLGSS